MMEALKIMHLLFLVAPFSFIFTLYLVICLSTIIRLKETFTSMRSFLQDNVNETQEGQMKHNRIKLYSPGINWENLSLRPQIIKAIKDMDYERPSQVQVMGIPPILRRKNLICQARSGTGKTSVFVIGILSSLAQQVGGQYLPHQCIVIAHTRELAYQIYQQFQKHGKHFKFPEVRYGCFFGGRQIQNDMNLLVDKKTSPHIIIGTVGRLLDLIQRRYISIKSCKSFVIDQCDKLLNSAGGYDELKALMNRLDKNTQKIMVSATIDEHARQVCRKLMENTNPVQVTINEGDLALEELNQYYCFVPQQNKFQMLQSILDNYPFDQAIIFANKVNRVREVGQMLDGILFNPIRIHSGLSQFQRLQNYDKFKSNGSRVLVASDLFGRGIDIPRVNLVINFDFPSRSDVYLHRVGRTCRFGAKGVVINFIKQGPNEDGYYDEERLSLFQKSLGTKIDPLPEVLE